jgi:hypothetical protein
MPHHAKDQVSSRRPGLAHLTRCQAGQATTEYVWLVMAVVLSLALISWGIQGNVLREISDGFTNKLLIVTTILKLPI